MIDNKYWVEIPLPDDSENSNVNRTQVVIGFNFPNIDLIEISNAIVSKDKNTGDIVSEIRQANINIYGSRAKQYKESIFKNEKTIKEVLTEIIRNNE